MNGQVAVARRRDPPDARVLAEAPAQMSVQALPLVLDLDAALPAGIGWELAFCALGARSSALPRLLAGAITGGAALERAACAAAGAALATLPFDPAFGAALEAAQAEDRPVILTTAGHAVLAEALSRILPRAEAVVAPDSDGPLGDLARLAAIRARCPAGFVALSGEDAPWARGAASYGDPAPEAAPARPSPLRLWAKALRLHQWAKNGLVFVPPILAGQALNPSAWALAACAFLAFGLAASATYLLNDLHDLAHDRAHRSKRHRPLASGALPIPLALAVAGLGLTGCAGLAWLGGAAGLATVAAYLGLTLAYTFAIKRHMLIDAVTLAGLFTLRLVGGIAFCGVAGSAWLLAFSMFVFTALALAKRFVEIEALKEAGAVRVAGRGYTAQDGPAVMALGAAASAAAVLILALYIVEAPERAAFYVHPDLLWAAPVALFLWLGRVWILCGRGALRDDPVEFALSDRPSLMLGLVILASFALACLRF